MSKKLDKPNSISVLIKLGYIPKTIVNIIKGINI